MLCTGTAQSVVTYASSIGHTGDHHDAEQLTEHIRGQALLVHIGQASLWMNWHCPAWLKYLTMNANAIIVITPFSWAELHSNDIIHARCQKAFLVFAGGLQVYHELCHNETQFGARLVNTAEVTATLK